MGPIGVPEMFAIFVIALLLFGPKKLPELGRTLGKALSEFRRAKNELKSTFESHLNELEKETRMTTTSSNSSTSTPSYTPTYSYPYEDYNHYDPAAPLEAPSSEINGTEESRAALPPSAGQFGPVESTAANEHESLPSLPPVSGTVARSNGVRPLSETTEQKAEDHHAPAREEHPV